MVAPAQTTPLPRNRRQIVWLPYVIAVIRLLLGFMLAILGARILAETDGSSFNPFAPFAAVFPGQSSDALADLGFSCPANTYVPANASAPEYCILNQLTGTFVQVGVQVADSHVRQVDFVVHDNRLRVGDLITQWQLGRPQVQGLGMSWVLSWPEQGVMVSTTDETGHFTLFLYVRRIYVTGTALAV